MVKKILATALLLSCIGLSGISLAQVNTVYVASKNSNKYHYTSCKWAKKISPENLVEFKSVKEAQAAGKIPCKVCKPPEKDK